MSLMNQIHTGRRIMPPRILMYGTEGIGKSTTASQAPKPIFIPTEDGLDQIDCASFPLAQRFDEVVSAISALYSEEHDYQSVVIDSLDWLERLIWDDVCREYGVKSIEKADGGYAKGYTHALTQWREVLNGLDALRNERGMAVILLAHAKVEKFEDPESVAYDRYSPRLHKHAAALVTEWCQRWLPSGVTVCCSPRASSAPKAKTPVSTARAASRWRWAPTVVSASSARSAGRRVSPRTATPYRLNCPCRGRR